MSEKNVSSHRFLKEFLRKS